MTQWQVVGCVSKISEQFLIPVLEAMLQQFPFGILGFHSDNGSEFINRRVAELLEKLLIEFTKSRASRTQDNALVEGKNGAIMRKLIGYGHIASEHAEALQKFYTAYLNPYLNSTGHADSRRSAWMREASANGNTRPRTTLLHRRN